jgi:hypothetical protein
LKVEREIVLNWRRGLHWLNFESCTDVGKSTGAEWEGLWMMRLPVLILSAEVESAGVLKVRRQDYGFVTGLTR